MTGSSVEGNSFSSSSVSPRVQVVNTFLRKAVGRMLSRSAKIGPKKGVGDFTDFFGVSRGAGQGNCAFDGCQKNGCVGIFHGKESRNFCRKTLEVRKRNTGTTSSKCDNCRNEVLFQSASSNHHLRRGLECPPIGKNTTANKKLHAHFGRTSAYGPVSTSNLDTFSMQLMEPQGNRSGTCFKSLFLLVVTCVVRVPTNLHGGMNLVDKRNRG